MADILRVVWIGFVDNNMANNVNVQYLMKFCIEKKQQQILNIIKRWEKKLVPHLHKMVDIVQNEGWYMALVKLWGKNRRYFYPSLS